MHLIVFLRPLGLRLLAGAVAADGGRPADDLMVALPGADWKEVTGEFFLTM